MRALLVLSLLFVSIQTAPEEAMSTTSRRLIDDFSGPASSMGPRWESFSDRVMGGRSDVEARLVGEEENGVLHLGGRVSLENNGGFIQARLVLSQGGKPYDASGFRGITLRVRGSGGGYYIHIRTSRTVFPWSFYGQRIPVTGEWRTVHLPFRDFESENMLPSRLNPAGLRSVAIVAAKENFFSDLSVDWIAFTR